MAGWVNATPADLSTAYVPSLAIYNLDNSHWEDPKGKLKECTFKHLNGQNHPQCLTNKQRTDYRKEFFTVNLSILATETNTLPSTGWTYVDPNDLALPRLPLPGHLTVEYPISICLYPISKSLSKPHRLAFYLSLLISLLPSTTPTPPASRNAARIIVFLFGISASILAWLQLDRPGNSEGTAFNLDSFVVLPLLVCGHLAVVHWFMDPWTTTGMGSKFFYYCYLIFVSVMVSLLLYIESHQSTALPAVVVKGPAAEGYRITSACYFDDRKGRTELWAPDTGVRIRSMEVLRKVELPVRGRGDVYGDRLAGAQLDAVLPLSIATMQTVLWVSAAVTVLRCFAGNKYGKGIQWGLWGWWPDWVALLEVVSFRGTIYLAMGALIVAVEGAIGRDLQSEDASFFHFSQWGLWLALILAFIAAPALFPRAHESEVAAREYDDAWESMGLMSRGRSAK